MNIAFKCMVVSLCSLLLCSCAAPVNHNTPSGRPEVSIKGRSGSQVQSEIMNMMLNHRYSIKSSSTNIIVFEKVFDNNVMASFVFGSRYDSTPHARVTFNIFEVGDSTRVIASFEAITNPGSAFERSTPLDNNPDTEKYQKELNDIKLRMESSRQ